MKLAFARALTIAAVVAGTGMVPQDAFAAVPTAPAIRVVPGNAVVTLAWTAPANGGRAISDYVVQFKRATSPTWLTFRDGVRATTGAAVRPLSNKVAYHFRVAARNASGLGRFSVPVTATPGLPGRPGRPVGRVSGPDVKLGWTAPVFTGGLPVIDYIVQCSNNGGPFATVNEGVSSFPASKVTMRPPGATVSCRVFAKNAVGLSPVSLASVAVRTPPPPTPLPTAYVGTLRTTHTHVYNGGLIHLTESFDAHSVRFERFGSAGQYGITAGHVTYVGFEQRFFTPTPDSSSCEVNLSGQADFSNWGMHNAVLTVADDRLTPLGPLVPGTGPVFSAGSFKSDGIATPWVTAVDACDGSQATTWKPINLGSFGSSPAWQDGPDMRHTTTASVLQGTRTVADSDGTWTYTWDLRAA